MRRHAMFVQLPALCAVIAVAAVGWPAQAHADTTADRFLGALGNAGIGSADPAGTVELGRSVCTMLSEPGQTAADIASKVADTGGMPLGPATMFTGLAISIFCPAMVSSI